MRILSAVVVSWLLSSSLLAAQSAPRWLAGLDIVIPAYSALSKDGALLPAENFLGYDNDTRALSMLYTGLQCYMRWELPAVPNEGGVRHLLQLNPTSVVLVYESGYLRIVPIPARTDWGCRPVSI